MESRDTSFTRRTDQWWCGRRRVRESSPRRLPAQMPHVPSRPRGRLSAPEPRVPAGHPRHRPDSACAHGSPPEGATDLQGRGGGAGAHASGGTGESPPSLSSQPQVPQGWDGEKPLRGAGRQGAAWQAGPREPWSPGCRAQLPGRLREGARGPSGPHAAGSPACSRPLDPTVPAPMDAPRLEEGAFRKSVCSVF